MLFFKKFFLISFLAFLLPLLGCSSDSGPKGGGSVDSGENNILPIADFSFTTDYLTARFTDNSKDLDGTIDAYLWEFGDGGTSVSASPVHIYAIEGRYNVRLTVTDNSGGKSVKTAQVTVLNSSSGGGGDNIPPIVDFTFVQYNYTVTFTSNASDTDGAVVDYLWEFGDGKTSSMRDISYTYFAPGIYNVKLTVTDNWGATAVKEASVIIKGTSPGEGAVR